MQGLIEHHGPPLDYGNHFGSNVDYDSGRPNYNHKPHHIRY